MDDYARLKKLFDEKGFSILRLANEIGLNEATIRSAMKKNLGSMGGDSLYKIAATVGTTIEELLGQAKLGPRSNGAALSNVLPVRYQTGGGNWVDVDRYFTPEPEMAAASLVAGVPMSDQWYERLEGDSMNLLIPPGALMHVISSHITSFKHGDIVIVERSMSGGHYLSRTAKQVAFTSEGLELWPRSTNPIWDGPINLNVPPEDESITIEIAGVVKRAVIEL
jgi:transcriptional regulator with XRE-family HTH domain